MQDQPKPPAAPPAKAAQGGGGRNGSQAPGIVFDSDMGRNIDTALALAVLYSLGPKGKVIAVGISNSSLEAAAYCDALGRFYTGDPAAQTTGTSGVLPVGLAEDGAPLGQSPMLSQPLALKNADGQAAFHHAIRDIIDTADARIIYRNALLTQKDGEGVVLLAGPATNLVKTLALNGGREAIQAKAGILVMAAGAFPEGPADPRIQTDIAAARQLLAKWPTPIVAVGTEVGNALPYPGRSIEADYSWTPQHPVVAAYRAWRPMPYDAPAQAVAAALYAGNRKDNYFQLSEPGTIEVLDDGRTRFTRSAAGRHRYLIVDPAQRDRVLQAYTTLASTKPTPPAPRVFRQQQNADKPADPAAATPKKDQ